MGFDDISAKKAFMIILITSLIIGLIGGIIGALLFEVPGPQGCKAKQELQAQTALRVPREPQVLWELPESLVPQDLLEPKECREWLVPTGTIRFCR